ERRGRGTTPWQHESPRTPPPDSIPTLPHPGGGVAVGWPPGRGKGAEGPPPPTPAFRLPAIHPSLTIGLLNFNVCPTVPATIPSAKTTSQSRRASGTVSSTVASGAK